MPNDNMTLKDAVDKAVETEVGDTHNEDGSTTKPDTSNLDGKVAVVPEDNAEGETETETEEVEEVAENPPDQETEFALNLLKSLKDPSQAVGTMQALAKQLGLRVEAGDISKREATASVKDIIKEGLGKDYEFLADRLGNVFEKALDQVSRGERESLKVELDKLRNQINTVEAGRVNTEINAELKALSERTGGASKKHEVEMTKWMAKYQPAPGSNISVSEFLDDAYNAVSRDENTARTVAKTVRKIVKNAGESNSSSTGTGGDNVTKGSQKLSVGDAVRLAMQGKKVSYK